MLKDSLESIYKQEFSNNDYDKYYFGIRYLGNRYLLSKLNNSHLKDKNILDIGSGRLILSSILSYSKSSIVASDLTEVVSNKFVRERAKIHDINLIGSRIEPGRTSKLPFKDCSFDLVLMTEVIEHLNFSPIYLIREIHRVMKEKGYLVLTTPNVHALENKIKFFLNKSIYANFDKYLESSPHDYHWREFDRNELFYILKTCNLAVQKMFYCNDILINKYNNYLYESPSKKIKAYLKKFMYQVTFLLKGYKKQIIVFASKN